MKLNISPKQKKILFAVIGAFLMTSGIFVLVSDIPTSHNPISVSPSLASQSETGSTSTAIDYYENTSAGSSTTTTDSIPVSENSTYTDVAFNSNAWSPVSGNQVYNWTTTLNLSSMFFYSPSTVELNETVFQLERISPNTGDNYSVLSTIWANLSLDGEVYFWSYSPDFKSNNTTNWYAFIDPRWNIDPNTYEWYGNSSVTFTSDVQYSLLLPSPSAVYSASPGHIASTNAYAGQNTIVQNPSYSKDVSIPFALGYYFTYSTSITPPNYEISYNVAWSASVSSTWTYDGTTETGTSGTFTGASIPNYDFTETMSLVSDPAVTGVSSISFSYYFSDQYQASPESTSSSASPSYTFNAVSATTNEASASFSFSASPPSNAFFGDYIYSDSLYSGTVTYTPTVTVTNPYSSYAQNELVASMSGSSSGSSMTSSTASPSFTGNEYTALSSTSPSWTVNLTLYGNVAPTYVGSSITTTTVNPLQPITLYANYSETDFSGEPQYMTSVWNGATYTTSTSTGESFSQTEHFNSPGTKTISFYGVNDPIPATNSLSSLDSSTDSETVTVYPFIMNPYPANMTKIYHATTLSMAFNTQTSTDVTKVTLSINGAVVATYTPDSTTGNESYSYSPTVAENLQAEWTATDQYGYSQSVTYTYLYDITPFILNPSPPDYSTVSKTVPLSLFFNTQTSVNMTLIDLYVNNVLEDRFEPDTPSGTVSYTYTQPESAPLLVEWSATDAKGYSQSVTFHYGSSILPSEFSNTVTVLQSQNFTDSYPISLSNVPTGTGTYQQLLTISNPSQYGINDIGSNLQFMDPNGTLLYAWEQSVNSSSMQVWVKNYYGNSIIDMQVLPSFENDFSETGYLGNATISNIKYVFPNMTVSGTAGLADTLPTGSLPGSVGFYAYSVGGDYIYMPMQDYGTNTNISFYVWSNGLGDFFFDANSAGTGNAFRFDTRSGSGSDDSQFMPTNSWTSWVSPPFNSYTPSPSTWYEGIIHFNSNGTVIGYWSYASQNAYGQNATSYYTVAHDGNYIGFIGDGYGSAYVTYWNGLKINGTTSMPLATISSIGTGSVFQANATTTSTFTGTNTGTYNTTYVYMTYNIPIEPTTNYTTILFNSTWILSNIYPSTYLPIIPKSDFVTLEDVKGFTTVQVTLVEPSQDIGVTTYQSIDYTMPSGIPSPTDYFTNIITYIPFGSSRSITEKTTSQFIEIPFGSTVSGVVQDPWGDTVGTFTNFLIGNTTGVIPLTLNVTELQFVFFNSTPGYVYLYHNGINQSFYNSAIVANGTTFTWTTSYYSVTSGQEQVKSGTVATDKPIQSLDIYLHAPHGDLQVSANAYQGSNLGTLTNSGNPRVESFINGQPYILGTTFSGFQGTTYKIRIADLLNQTLFETNVTLQSSFTSLTVTITSPSYWMGIENDEQVPQDSPLATEYMSIHPVGVPADYYNFTDSVGQNWLGYFLAGNYSVYMHDNVTNTFFVNISKSNEQYYLNGQALLNLTDFDKKINQLLNYTESITNTTYGLHIAMQSSIFSGQVGKTVYYEFGVYYNNYTPVSQSFLKNSSFVLRITNSTGSIVTITQNSSISGNIYTVALTPDVVASYGITLIVLHTPYAGVETTTLSVSLPVIIEHGINIQLTGPASLSVGASGDYYIVLDYTNGSLLNSTDTAYALKNTTIEVLVGADVVENITPSDVSKGVFSFVFSSTTADSYSLEASTHLYDGSNVSATYILPVSVQGITTNIQTVPIDTPEDVQINQQITYLFEFRFANGNLLTSADIDSLLANSTISIRNSLSLTYTTYVNDNELYVNFSSPDSGYYTFSMAGFMVISGNTYSFVYSSPVYIAVPQILSNGMHLDVSGPASISDNVTSAFFLSFSYENGTAFNQADTEAAIANLTVDLYSDSGTLITALMPSYYEVGIIEVYVNVSISGSYYILATSHLNDPTHVSGSDIFGFTSISLKSTQTISVIPIDTPSTYISGQNGSYVFNLAYPNGTILNDAQLKAIIPYLNITLLNSRSVQITLAVYDNHLVANFTLIGYGYYTISIYGEYKSGLITYSISHAQQLTVNQITKSSVGMSVAIGIDTLATNKSALIPVYLYYGNGTAFNLTETGNAFAYTTLYVLQGNTIVHTYAPIKYSAGTIEFSIAALPTGQYTFYVVVLSFDINGSPVHASTTKVIPVSPPSVSPLTSFEDFWSELWNSISQNLLVTFLVTLAILALAYLVRIIWKKIRGDKQTATQINDTILADAVKQLEHPYGNMTEALYAFSALEYSEQTKFLTASREVLRLEQVEVGGKMTNLDKVRDYILKVKKHPDGNSILSRLAKKVKDAKSSGGKK